MVLEQNLSLVNKVNRLLRWGHWFTFANILLALPVTLSFFLADPLPDDPIGWLYLLINWLGHTAFLSLLFFIITVFPISLVFPSQRHIRGVAAMLATVGLVVLIFDAYVYHALGYHAGSASYLQTLELLRQQVITNLRNFILITGTVAGLVFTIELIISNFCWKKIERLKRSGIGRPALLTLLFAFSASHLLHIWGDATSHLSITRQDNVLPLSYPATARTVLSRYQVIVQDNAATTPSSLLTQALEEPQLVALSCSIPNTVKPMQIWLVDELNAQQQQLLSLQNFKQMPQQLAPTNRSTALTNLLHGQIVPDLLNAPPQWLEQLPAGTVQFIADEKWQHELPWLGHAQADTATKGAAVQFYLQQDTSALTTRLKQRGAAEQMLVISITGAKSSFALGNAPVWYHWPALRARHINDVSQHLDLIPTLLGALGCQNTAGWLGDNWLSQPPKAKLNIIGQQIFAFRKDKMLQIDADGEFSVWSAGTFVRLESKPDLPLLTDALNRLHKKPSLLLPR